VACVGTLGGGNWQVGVEAVFLLLECNKVAWFTLAWVVNGASRKLLGDVDEGGELGGSEYATCVLVFICCAGLGVGTAFLSLSGPGIGIEKSHWK